MVLALARLAGLVDALVCGREYVDVFVNYMASERRWLAHMPIACPVVGR